MLLYKDLNIDIPLFKKGYDFSQTSNHPWSLFDINFINQDMKIFFNTLGLEIYFAGLFTTIGKINTTIHLDGHNLGNHAKLNWVISSNHDHKMNWYKVKDNIQLTPSIRHSEKDLPKREYVNFLENEVEYIDSHTVKFPSLINAGLPHNVSNNGGIRKCLSIALKNFDKQSISMKDAVELFKIYST